MLAGKRKSVRPLSSKDSIHFVLRSNWARGKDSFLAPRNCKIINNIITRFAKKFGVRIYERSINGNHIHLLLKITNRPLYRAFIKAVSGKIASHVMGEQSFLLFREARDHLYENRIYEDHIYGNRINRDHNSEQTSERGDGATAAQKTQSFWEFRPFSRIVSWGRDFKTCVNYLKQNVLEALGFVPYKIRKNNYAKWLNECIPALTDPLKNRNTAPDLTNPLKIRILCEE